MKRNIFMLSIIFLLLIVSTNYFAVAQTADRSFLKNKIEENNKKLQSEDFEVRYNAVYFFSNLKKEELSGKVFKLIIDVFKKEVDRRKIFDEFVRKGGVAKNLPKNIAYINSEEYGMYHSYLCELTGKAGDNNLLPLLVEYCLSKEVLINFGDAAVEPIVNVLKTSDNPVKKMSAIFVLGEMLKPKDDGYVARGQIRDKIKEILVQSAKNSDRDVRSVSVKALGESADNDVIPLLNDIANNDPYCVKEKDASDAEITRCPVRVEAQSVLKMLRKKKK